MPNRNGQGPMGAGSGTGRGRGLCNKNNQAGVPAQERVQSQATTEQQPADDNCRGPRSCCTGKGRQGGACNNGRGQR